MRVFDRLSYQAVEPAYWLLRLSKHVLQLAGNLFPFKYFDLIAWFDIVVVFHPDAAFGTRFNFFDIILEAAQ